MSQKKYFICDILENIILKNEFNDYPLGEYNQVIGNTVYKTLFTLDNVFIKI